MKNLRDKKYKILENLHIKILLPKQIETSRKTSADILNVRDIHII